MAYNILLMNLPKRALFIKSDESETYLSLYAYAITPLLAEINTIDGDYQLSKDNRVFQWENGVYKPFFFVKKSLTVLDRTRTIIWLCYPFLEFGQAYFTKSMVAY